MVITGLYDFAPGSIFLVATGEEVWGTMERIEEQVVCALYKNRETSVRTGARITQTGILPFSPELEQCIDSKNVGKVFHGIGGCWGGKYNLGFNNCIHYALECWKQLGGTANWNDVCDGHDSFLFGTNDAGGRDCTIM